MSECCEMWQMVVECGKKLWSVLEGSGELQKMLSETSGKFCNLIECGTLSNICGNQVHFVWCCKIKIVSAVLQLADKCLRSITVLFERTVT